MILRDYMTAFDAEQLLCRLPGDNADLYEDDADDLMEILSDEDAFHPAYLLQEFTVDEACGDTLVIRGVRIRASLFDGHIKAGDTLYVFLATVGQAMDKTADGLDDPMLSYLMGVCENACLEEALYDAARTIAQKSSGDRLMMVIPGIAGICELSQQKELLSLVEGEVKALGVSASENGILSPTYSALAVLFSGAEGVGISGKEDADEKAELIRRLNVIAGHV